jgi:hypothetical protein
MKKTLALAIGLILATSLAACGKDDSIIPPPHQTSAQSREQARTEESPIINGDWRSAIPINDPALLRDIHDFTHRCYGNARGRLSSHSKDKPKLSPEQTQDTQWIGSKFFLETPGYYKDIPDLLPHTIWPEGEPNGDGNVLVSCAEWWKNEKHGIYPRLLKAVKNPELLTRIGYWVEPLPQLKTLSDFQQFFEQGATCQNNWSEEMVTNHFISHGPDLPKIQEDALKALEEEVRKAGFATELIPSDTGELRALVIHPQDLKIKVFGAEVEEIRIDGIFGNFTVILNTNLTHLRNQLEPLKLIYIPPFDTPNDGVIGPFFRPPENYLSKSHNNEFIDVRKKCEDSKTDPQKRICYEDKSVVDCFFPLYD